MENEHLIEAFEKVAGMEYQRLIKGSAIEREAAMHLLKLAEYVRVLDLELLHQELHHEYVNS